MNSYLLKQKVGSLLRVKPGKDFEAAFRELSFVRVKTRKDFLELRHQGAIFFYPLEMLKKVFYTIYIIALLFSLPAFVGLSAMSNNPLMIALALYLWQYLIRRDIPWPLYAIVNWEKDFRYKY